MIDLISSAWLFLMDYFYFTTVSNTLIFDILSPLFYP